MLLSIVSTLYHSSPFLREFYARAAASADRLGLDWEIVFVNDGSPDDSLAVALTLHQQDPRVRVIDLARNFGHHKAMMTGLAHAKGELVFLLDSDLEEEPELLETFHRELSAREADVVYGVQEQRKGNWFERISGDAFYLLFNWLSGVPIPQNVITARLMRRSYVNALIRHQEREIMIAGLWVLTGFKQIPLTVKKHAHAATTYTLARKLTVLVDAVTSFSNEPLILIFYLGCMLVLTSSTAALILITRALFFGKLLAGWASLIVSIWLLSGLIIFCLGLIGIYLSKIFTETKQRPYTIIKHVYEHAHSEQASTSAPQNVSLST